MLTNRCKFKFKKQLNKKRRRRLLQLRIHKILTKNKIKKHNKINSKNKQKNNKKHHKNKTSLKKTKQKLQKE